MFARFVTALQLRRSTAFLLQRRDDRLLCDIGLTRDDLQRLHLGLDLPGAEAAALRFGSLPLRRTLPAAV